MYQREGIMALLFVNAIEFQELQFSPAAYYWIVTMNHCWRWELSVKSLGPDSFQVPSPTFIGVIFHVYLFSYLSRWTV